jgi:exonuclease SbcD
MSFEEIRFVHAANVGLDTPVRTTDALPSRVVDDFEQARLHSFERVLAACIDRNVDFLLLSGDVFIERERSLHSRIVIRDAIERMADHDIQVFVIPNHSSPGDAWRAIPQLPSNLTICDSWSNEPIAVLREGKVIATISNGRSFEDSDDFGIRVPTVAESPQRQVFRVGVFRPRLQPPDLPAAELNKELAGVLPPDPSVVPIEQQCRQFLGSTHMDYVVLNGLDERISVEGDRGLAHCPGKTQSHGPRDQTPAGCSLVQVDTEGNIQVARLPTETVRWHELPLVLNKVDHEEDFLAALRNTMATLNPTASERIWLLRWTIRGNGQFIDQLHNDDVVQQVVDQIEESREAGPIQIVHTFKVVPGGELDLRQKPLAAEFVARLDEQMPVTAESLRKILAEGFVDDPQWAERLESLIPELDYELIAGQARRMGLKWFGSVREEGSAA